MSRRPIARSDPDRPAAANLAAPQDRVAGIRDGVVVATHGRHCLVRVNDGENLHAVTRGRQTDVCVGDKVVVRGTAIGQGVIEQLHARRNAFMRSDAWRSKRLASNIDQAAVVIASSPPFSEELLMRVLVAADQAGVRPLLIANKTDLGAGDMAHQARLDLYRQLGIEVVETSARGDPRGTIERLGARLANRCTLLLGQSGMGKSTLVNLLVPDARLRTQTISRALSTGRHTTTFCRMFDLPDGGTVIDSPGFQTFGLAHLSPSELDHAMPELRTLLGQCRFNNCTHLNEPGCAVLAAVRDGCFEQTRYRLYSQIASEVRAHAR